MNQENTEQSQPNMNPSQPDLALIIAKLEALESNQNITNSNLAALTAQQAAMFNNQLKIQESVNKLIPPATEQPAQQDPASMMAAAHAGYEHFGAAPE